MIPVRHVMLIEDGYYVEEALDESTARQDDAFWARFTRTLATPQRFIHWWIARRWVVPRDPSKR